MKKPVAILLMLALLVIAALAPAASAEEQPYIILVNALVGHPVYEQQAVA